MKLISEYPMLIGRILDRREKRLARRRARQEFFRRINAWAAHDPLGAFVVGFLVFIVALLGSTWIFSRVLVP